MLLIHPSELCIIYLLSQRPLLPTKSHLCFLPQNKTKSLTASGCVATFAQDRERDSSHRAASTGAHKHGNRFPEAETWDLYSTLLGKSSHLLHSSLANFPSPSPQAFDPLPRHVFVLGHSPVAAAARADQHSRFTNILGRRKRSAGPGWHHVLCKSTAVEKFLPHCFVFGLEI